MTLPIVDWLDLDRYSREYAFLKELGVREVPPLSSLINRLVEEHHSQPLTLNEYQLPQALTFFAENFQEHYSKGWKNEKINIAFLPSFVNESNGSRHVILCTPETVFKGLCDTRVDLCSMSLFSIQKKDLCVHLFCPRHYDALPNTSISHFWASSNVLR